MMKKCILMLFFLLLVNAAFAVDKPQIFMPYPIVFVSGIGTKLDADAGVKGSPSRTWPERRVFKELEKYFLLHPEVKESVDSKYDLTDESVIKNLEKLKEKPHLEFLFYDAREATLSTNADLLEKKINNMLGPEGGYYKPDTYTYTAPCATPKVILVCHSLGGLIARKMLVDNHDNIRDKVAAIFFIGTQQEGSPLGAVAYFLPKEIVALENDLKNIDNLIDGASYLRKRALINVRKKEDSKIIGNLLLMKWAERDDKVSVPIALSFSLPGLYVSTRDAEDNKQLSAVLPGGEWPGFEEIWGLPKVTEKGVVKGTLINSNTANRYKHTFEAYSFNGPFGTGVGARVVRAPELTYELSEGVFSNPVVDRDIGNVKAHAIAGNLDAVLRVGFCGIANSLMGWDNFNSLDYSCIEAGFWDGGDGFANLASQEAIVPAANVHEIPASHGAELNYPATPNIILQAIDDKPIVDDISIMKGWEVSIGPPTFNYVKVKVKDYLLADVEILEMMVNDKPVDLTSFLDTETQTYKPYFKYKKDFLKERTDTNAPLYHSSPPVIYSYLTLQPGEFWVRIDEPYIYSVFVKVKNAAGKESFKEIVPVYYAHTYRYGYAAGSSPQPISFSDISATAYDSFMSNKELNFTYGPSLFDFYLGVSAHSLGGPYEEGNQTQYSYWAEMEMYCSQWMGFKFHSPPDQIKPFKVRFDCYDWGHPGSSHTFNVLVYHDTSNNWPPAPDSNADRLLSTYTVIPLSSQYIDIDVDPQQDIGSNGYYVLQFRPDFAEYNCIPQPDPVTQEGQFDRLADISLYSGGAFSSNYLYIEVESK